MRTFGRSRIMCVLNMCNRERCLLNYRKMGTLCNDDELYPKFYVEEASLYVHWPYCKKRCHFCNFNKYLDLNVNHERMRSCLVREVTTLLKETGVKRINSLFFGGGTPNLAEPETIEAVLKAVLDTTELITGAEVTMETNPVGNSSSKLEDFKAAGINRVSVGVQALDDNSLKLLGREHTVKEAFKTLEIAKRLFPHRTSVDVLYGLPGQTLDAWFDTLGQLIPLLDDHVSVYQLTLERGTKLFKMCEEGRVATPEEDVLADMYDLTLEKLKSCGFNAYEISNFSRSLENQSIHNRAYWQGKQYIGIGPGAHSREVLGELLAVGLRTSEGVTDHSWRALSSKAPTMSECFAESPRLAWLFESGLLQFTTNSLCATHRGWKVLDHIVPHLLHELERVFGSKVM